MFGEMSVDPISIPATGNTDTEVMVRVFQSCEAAMLDLEPTWGAEVVFYSSRNVIGAVVDTFSTTSVITNEDGLATTNLSSSTVGEAVIGIFVDGELLCDIDAISENECLAPVVEIVTFTSP